MMKRSLRQIPPCLHASRGLALVAVLWMVAALSLLAAALAAGTRTDISVLQADQASVQAQALGDAAIHVVAARLQHEKQRPTARLVEPVFFEGVELRVSITPSGGLIDLNQAPEELLYETLLWGGGLSAAEAEHLVAGIVEWRTQAGRPSLEGEIMHNARTRFDAVEDLMYIPGMNLDLFDRIRDLVTTSGSSGVAPLAAPVSVLEVLAGGDRQLAGAIAAQRDAQDPVIDLTRLSSTGVAGDTGTWRLDAIVPMADGRSLRRTAWINLSQNVQTGSPWRLFDFVPVRGAGGEL